jgi:hypothetical protein
MNLLKTILTEDKANAVFDPLRLGAVVAFLTLIGLLIYDVVGRGHAFDIQASALGLGGFLTATGTALWASSHQKDAP